MTHRRIVLFLVIVALMLASCGGGTSATPTPVLSQWQKIMAAYVGPDSDPDATTLRRSFIDIMDLANEIVMDEAYTADEVARAQAIFDAAADAHEAMVAGDTDKAALRWQSLGRFMVWLEEMETATP